MSDFLLSCESTVDLPYEYMQGRKISVLFYTYTVGTAEYEDDMCRSKDGQDRFYEMLKGSDLPSTSQINVYKYAEYFEKLLQNNDNILHIGFGSGMTPSVNNAVQAAALLSEKYPDKTVTVVDSLCSCCGYGMLVDTAADMRDEGKSADEIKNWIIENRCRIHHQFFSSDIKMFKRSGRVCGLTAAFATILGICPIMHLNAEGRIVAYGKERGKKSAIKKTVDETLAHIKDGKKYDGKFFISHSRCLDDAKDTENALVKAIPSLKGKIKIFEIGNIIASHCGEGTVAVYFFGDERTQN